MSLPFWLFSAAEFKAKVKTKLSIRFLSKPWLDKYLKIPESSGAEKFFLNCSKEISSPGSRILLLLASLKNL